MLFRGEKVMFVLGEEGCYLEVKNAHMQFECLGKNSSNSAICFCNPCRQRKQAFFVVDFDIFSGL